jgi:hypothetical protein
MLTDTERTQLTEEYRREPVSPVGLLLTCAAGLAIVVVLALLGMQIHNFDGAAAPTQSAAQAR